MLQISLIILSIFTIVLMTACGNNNLQRPANINDDEAILFKTGRDEGRAESLLIPEFKDKKPSYAEQNKIFENVDIDINWEEKTVAIKAEYIKKDAHGKSSKENVVMEGRFNKEGIAYLKPNPDKNKFIAGVRCEDACDSLIIDMGVNVGKDGDPKLQEQQFKFISESKVEAEVETEAIAEIVPAASGLGEPSVPKAAAKKKQTAKSEKNSKAKPTEKKAEQKVEPKLTEEQEDPGVPSLRPTTLVDKMMMGQKAEEISIDQFYKGSTLFPIPLGEKYPGRAAGYYSHYCGKDPNTKKRVCGNGSLVAGTDVVIDGKKSVEKRVGFNSVDRGDKIHYGSGLLVKVIEEAGKAYARMTNGAAFEVNDLSKKAGGKVGGHGSHQNGLDADILLPKKAGQVDYPKVWAIVKSAVLLGHVDVIFLSPPRIKSLCTYLKNSKEKNYSEIFKKFYPWPNHMDHLHLRIKCDIVYNRGCIPSAYEGKGICN